MRRRTQAAVKLPLTLAVGFTGHRNLPDEANCGEAIRKVLANWKANAPGLVYGVSSAAAGGDLLFAEICEELKLPVRVLLPLPKALFRGDFDAPTWERVERVLASALSVEVVSGSEAATERYYECGIETVHQCQLLIALWNGAPAQGMGGTADIVHFARNQGRPIVWINSTTGVVRQLNENPTLLHDPEIDFLNGLPDPIVTLPTMTARELAQAWFAKLDDNASRVAPQFRRLAAIPIFCTAAAAVLGGAVAFPGVSTSWLSAGTALGVMAAALPVVMRLEKRQVAWTRVRTAAEVCRSCLALWYTPTPYSAVGPEVVPELAGILTSLNFLKMSDRAPRETTLEEFKRRYLAERVQNQIAYFSRYADHSAREVRRYQAITWVSVFVGASVNVWLVWRARGLDGIALGNWKPALALGATMCFQIATVAAALLIVNDHQRRRERYLDLHRMLVHWGKQLELSQTWPVLLRIASMVEKALLAELIEWRSLIRHRKVPRA